MKKASNKNGQENNSLYYVVTVGRKKGIFRNQDIFRAQIENFENAQYGTFKSMIEAQYFLREFNEAEKKKASIIKIEGSNESITVIPTVSDTTVKIENTILNNNNNNLKRKRDIEERDIYITGTKNVRVKTEENPSGFTDGSNSPDIQIIEKDRTSSHINNALLDIKLNNSAHFIINDNINICASNGDNSGKVIVKTETHKQDSSMIEIYTETMREGGGKLSPQAKDKKARLIYKLTKSKIPITRIYEILNDKRFCYRPSGDIADHLMNLLSSSSTSPSGPQRFSNVKLERSESRVEYSNGSFQQVGGMIKAETCPIVKQEAPLFIPLKSNSLSSLPLSSSQNNNNNYNNSSIIGNKRQNALNKMNIKSIGNRNATPIKPFSQSNNKNMNSNNNNNSSQYSNNNNNNSYKNKTNNNNNKLREVNADGITKPKKEIPLSSFCEEQLAVFREFCFEKKSIFLTGSAGTGKSYVLRAIIDHLTNTLQEGELQVCATTAIAALNIHGRTIHSFAGIELGTFSRLKLFKLAWNKKKDWRSCKVLIIDEISMLSAYLFQSLEEIARAIRGDNRPFGGIQLLLAGDFFQLPPVKKDVYSVDHNANVKKQIDPVTYAKENLIFPNEEKKIFTLENGMGYAFETDEWEKCIDKMIELKTIYRQSDAHFINILNQIRFGIVTPEATTFFKSLSRPLPVITTKQLNFITKNNNNNNNNNSNSDSSGNNKQLLISDCMKGGQTILPTKLYCTNKMVDGENELRLSEINQELVTIKALDIQASSYRNHLVVRSHFSQFQSTIENAQRNCLSPPLLKLKVGAQVMLLRNTSPTLVNGSRGVVVGFRNINLLSIREVTSQSSSSPFTPQSPSFPSSSSPSLSSLPPQSEEEISVSTLFGSVPISDEATLMRYLKYYAGLREEKLRLPIVEFVNGERLDPVLPICNGVTFGNIEFGYRVQIPLKLAWSITIHKSQGMSLDLCELELSSTFASGQAYVALSRCVSSQTLRVMNFNPRSVYVDPTVIKFSQSKKEEYFSESKTVLKK